MHLVAEHFVAAILVFKIAASQSCNFVPQARLNDGTPANVYLETDSRNCTLNLSKPIPEVCDVNEFDIFFSPAAVIPKTTNMWPYIDLNITVISKVFASDIFVQLECLSSPSIENVYCHDHAFLSQKYGQFFWPCRQHRVLNPKKEVHLPYTFEHACFRMHGLSQYRLNVTILPQRCHLSYLVIMPTVAQVEPRFKTFLNSLSKKPLLENSWSPMVTLDMNDPNALNVRFARGNESASTEVAISVYKKETGTLNRLHQRIDVTAPETSAAMSAPAGEYVVFVYVDYPHCKLQCGPDSGKDCSICSFTYTNFTLLDHKLDVFQRFKHYFLHIAEVLCYVVVIVLIVGLIIVSIMYAYYKWILPRIMRRRPAQAFSMTATPDVLIVYTDDCPEHTAAISAFADILERHANAHVLMDTKDLLDPSVKPSIWLMRAISEAKFIILVFSAASKQVINGKALPPRRPFPDLFSPAVQAVTTRINELTSHHGVDLSQKPLTSETTALNRFIVARFDYTCPTAVPDFFALLNCRHVVIPQDLGRLFGYLHEINAPSDNAIIEIDADLTELKEAIYQFQKFATTNPNWLSERITENETIHYDPRETERLPLNTIKEVSTVDELAQRYDDLCKPDDDDDEDETEHGDTGIVKSNEQFELLGSMNDISSDSDS